MRLSIRSKSGLFLAGYTLVLEGSILSYLYVSGRETIRRVSREEVQSAVSLAKGAVERAVSDALAELGALRTQMVLAASAEGAGAARREMLSELAVTGAARYANLELHYPPDGRTTQVRAVREFRRAYPVVQESSGGSPSAPGEGQLRITLPVAIAGSPSLFADIHLEALLDPLGSLALPPGVRVLAMDARDLILAAPEPRLLRTYLRNSGLPLDRLAVRREAMVRPEVTLAAYKDESAETGALRRRLRNVAVFTALATALAFAVVWTLTTGMARSLRAVVETANHVAHGDFSRRIGLRRDDELGDLITSINEMTGRLDSSYRDLQNVNRRLSVKIEELTRTRRRLSEKQRLAAVGEALSKISHEIQNKVGGVGVWVQNLERFGARDENSRMCVAELRSAIDGLLDMLIHFKRFYRLPAVDPRPVEAQTVLRECAARAEAAARAKEVAVEWEAPAAPLTAAADPPQLTDALVNLVLNAVEASPSGGAVTLSLRAEDGWAVYSVRDRGPGIPPKARIFRPFFTTKPSGSGLGLSIVRNIARAHRGHVRAFNPPGGGACFEIRVPAVSGDTP